MNGRRDEGAAPAWPEPRRNAELVGHEEAERTLLEAFQSGRLAHGWLLAGPEGIGKATLAYRFARFVLAGGSPELFGTPRSLHVDPGSPVFRRVASGGHADLMAVERGDDPRTGRLRTEIVVADARAVGGFLHMTPAEGGWRVVVIDSVDEMNRNAANALLKALEEPPDQALLLLVSHNPGRLLPTVRSRCRRLTLRPLSPERVGEVLARFRPDLDAGDAEALTRLAGGSPGRALRLATEGGLDLYREMMDLLAALPAPDPGALHGLGERLARPGAEAGFRTAAGLLTWWLARMIRTGARGRGVAAADGEIVPGEAELMRRFLARASLEQWVEVWEKISRLFARADTLDRKQVVLNAFLALANVARP